MPWCPACASLSTVQAGSTPATAFYVLSQQPCTRASLAPAMALCRLWSHGIYRQGVLSMLDCYASLWSALSYSFAHSGSPFVILALRPGPDWGLRALLAGAVGSEGAPVFVGGLPASRYPSCFKALAYILLPALSAGEKGDEKGPL